MTRRRILSMGLLAVVAGLVHAQPTDPVRPNSVPEYVSVVVGRFKGTKGYYFARVDAGAPAIGPNVPYNATVNSPKVDLNVGQQFQARWSEPNTYMAGISGQSVWVYVE